MYCISSRSRHYSSRCTGTAGPAGAGPARRWPRKQRRGGVWGCGPQGQLGGMQAAASSIAGEKGGQAYGLLILGGQAFTIRSMLCMYSLCSTAAGDSILLVTSLAAAVKGAHQTAPLAVPAHSPSLILSPPCRCCCLHRPAVTPRACLLRWRPPLLPLRCPRRAACDAAPQLPTPA